MSRIFISHASADRAFVESELLGLLKALGFDPWYSEAEIYTGEQWERSILAALRTSKWLLLVMSPRSAQSEWVKDEIFFQITENPDRIVPVMIEACNPEDFHIRLRRLQWLDFRNPTNAAREELVRILVDGEYKPFVRHRDTSDALKRAIYNFWHPLVAMSLYTTSPPVRGGEKGRLPSMT